MVGSLSQYQGFNLDDQPASAQELYQTVKVFRQLMLNDGRGRTRMFCFVEAIPIKGQYVCTAERDGRWMVDGGWWMMDDG